MSGIIGTVTTVKALYEKQQVDIGVGNLEKTKVVTLNANREYSVPLFQREIRWEKNHLLTLIADVVKNPKFLGNIILTKKDDNSYEILDGQQRTTVIYLLLLFLKKKYQDRFSVFDTCPFSVQSFEGFKKLYHEGFDRKAISDEEWSAIDESDHYKQKNKYLELWNYINASVLLDNPKKAKDFLDNLSKCELNVIISLDSEELGIERFLDVNLKGVKLDTEDIFKGYLCAQDNSQNIHDIWSRLKKLDAKINPTEYVKDKAKTKTIYAFMTIVEHFFRCKLSEYEEYKDIEFDSNFNLTSEKKIEGTIYCEGTHLISAICNQKFIMDCLSEIELVMQLIESIVNSTDTSDLFGDYIKKYNTNNPKHKIEDNECRVMHNLTKKILRDADTAPNCMLIKYFLDAFLKKMPQKEDFKKIYAVSSAGLMFSLFEPKKDLTVIRNLIRGDDWYSKTCGYIYDKFTAQASSMKMVRVSNFNDDTQKFRSKSLATIYDFYECEPNSIRVKANKINELEEFLNDDTICSMEHFVINDKDKIDYVNAKGLHIEYQYPQKIKKYKNALLNFIFIAEALNNDMGNLPVCEKVNRLTSGKFKERFKAEKSEYSKMVVRCVKKYIKMPRLDELDDLEVAKQSLDKYYESDFENQFIEFTKAVFSEMEIK